MLIINDLNMNLIDKYHEHIKNDSVTQVQFSEDGGLTSYCPSSIFMERFLGNGILEDSRHKINFRKMTNDALKSMRDIVIKEYHYLDKIHCGVMEMIGSEDLKDELSIRVISGLVMDGNHFIDRIIEKHNTMFSDIKYSNEIYPESFENCVYANSKKVMDILKKLNIHSIYYLFWHYDEEEDEDYMTTITSEEYNECVESNIYIHPELGIEMNKWDYLDCIKEQYNFNRELLFVRKEREED